MDCQESKRYLHAFLDDELDVKTNIEIQGHLHQCNECRSRLEFERRMRGLVGKYQLQEEAPAYLRNSIAQMIGREERPKITWFNAFFTPRLRLANGLILSVSLVAVAIMASLLYFNRQENMTAFASEAVNNHIMYFFGEMPVEFVSSESRDVTNWFSGRPNFVTDVPEFRGGRLDLVGGRLCSTDSKRAAHIMYNYNDRGYRLSLFSFSSAQNKPTVKNVIKIGDKTFFVNEFKDHNVVLWKEKDVVYSMVSDIGGDELMDLTQFVNNK